MEHSQYVMTTEAAQILKVSSETVRGWANTGKLPFVATGRGVRFFERAVVEQLAQERAAGKRLSLRSPDWVSRRYKIQR